MNKLITPASEKRKKLAEKEKKKKSKHPVINAITLPQKQLSTLFEHYQNGRYDDAEKMALLITQEFPENQFAWKVLGALLEKKGMKSEALNANQKAVQLVPQDAQAHSNLGITLQALGRLEEAKASYRQAIAIKPDYAKAHNNLGLTLYDLGRLKEAEASYRQAIAIKRDYAKAHNNLGLTLYDLGRLKEAEASYRQAISIKPDYAQAHNNLGLTLYDLGRLKEAEASYRQAIALKSDFAEAHCNLGVALYDLGRLKEAEASYRQAIALKSDFADAHCNLGVVLQELGKYEDAIAGLNKAMELKPDFDEVRQNLGLTLTLFKAKSFSSQLEKNYLDVLNLETRVVPAVISHSVITLLKHHNTVKEAISYTKKNDIKNSVCELCIRLSNIPLFLKIIELCPIADLEIENLLKNLRKMLLLERRTLSNNHNLLRFQSSLALQCFTNEFIYEEIEEETLAVKALETALQQSFTGDEDVSPYDIACLAGYRPLHLYPWATDVNPPSKLASLLERQVIEVNQELALRRDIPRLNPIENDVSLAVQKQYEENPYPRWINTRIEPKPLTIVQLLSKLEFQFDNELNHFPHTPQVLVAGCGTGQHSLGTASRFKNSHVTAIDLSLSSLSYAIRKTREYGVTNIDYIQADILDLGLLGKQFDIVESVGVLHHMKDPLLGWKVLESCLKPGGLMRIGLYGEVARKHIVKARDLISNLNIGTSHKEMIAFREYIKGSTDPTLTLLKSEVDFYSTSNFRDLVFHVQEHRFTAPELYRCFNTLDLIFIGFEYSNLEEKKRNQALYPNWGRGANCGLSDELDFPTHCFWLQKPLSYDK